jgi:hypothetical protein
MFMKKEKKSMLKLNFRKPLALCSAVLLGLLSFQPSLQSTWEAPVVISNPDIPQATGSSFFEPVLKVNPPGNAIAVWVDAYSTVFDETAITTAFYQQGSGWQAPVVISSLTTNCNGDPSFFDQEAPDIAMNSTNYAVAVWDGIDNSECDILTNSPMLQPDISVIFASTRSATGIWTFNGIISNEDYEAYFANVSLNEDGTALAAWVNQDDDGDTFIAASFLPFGGSWATQTNFTSFLNLNPGDGKPYPFINSLGNAVITWQGRSTATNYAIQAVTNTLGIWSAVATLDTNTDGNLSQDPRCALAANGNGVAIWQNDFSVNAAFFNGTSWGSISSLGTTAIFYNNDGPEVVVDPFGNFTATWTSDGNVIMSASTSNGTWSVPQAISTSGTLNGFDPYQSQETLAVNQQGDVIAIWYSLEDSEAAQLAQPSLGSIISNYMPFGAPWGTEETVADPSDSFDSGSLNVGLANCGFAVALWQNGDDSLVYASVNENLNVPLDPIALQCCQKGVSGKRCVNILTWTQDPCVLYYNIYCNGTLIAVVVNTGGALQFVDPSVCSNCVYTISAVSALGFASDPVSFTVL